VTMSKSPFWGVPMDEQVLGEIGRRNRARVDEVIEKLGGAWVFARTRRPQPHPPQAIVIVKDCVYADSGDGFKMISSAP
jgi:hypothetical protein